MKVLFIKFLLLSVFISVQTMLAQPSSELPDVEVMQGPMVGAVSSSTISIWVRINGEYDCKVAYDTDPEFDSPLYTETVKSSSKADYSAVITLENLKPNTRYYYKVLVEGTEQNFRDIPDFYANTAPNEGANEDFRLAFGSCTKYREDRIQPIWEQALVMRPDLLFRLGDNVYSDNLDTDFLKEQYRRQRNVATLQPVLHTIPQLAIWDDHDYGLNDSDRRNLVKDQTLPIFKSYWANPSYGETDNPGVYFKYQYANVDFFFLDGRYYRDPNNGPERPDRTMLGKKQLQWLEEGLKNSRALFKVLISASGWTKGRSDVSVKANDSWSSFMRERNALFDFIKDNNIPGVVLLSGDTHVGELNAIPWSEKGGYDFYDLVSSPLAQETERGSFLDRKPEVRIRSVYFNLANIGIIDFRLSAERPYLQFNLVSEKGTIPWKKSFRLYADELGNGVSSWKDKVSLRKND